MPWPTNHGKMISGRSWHIILDIQTRKAFDRGIIRYISPSFCLLSSCNVCSLCEWSLTHYQVVLKDEQWLFLQTHSGGSRIRQWYIIVKPSGINKILNAILMHVFTLTHCSKTNGWIKLYWHQQIPPNIFFPEWKCGISGLWCVWGL